MTTAATILIIDDEPSLNRMLSTFLSSKGYHVLTASDGRQGLELAMTKNPDLVLCDLTMPTLDGLEVIARLRQNESGREIPIIILSGTGERKHVRQSMNLGGDDFLAKPASLSEILAAIQARLERRQQQRLHQEQLVQTALASYSGIINDVGNPDHPVQWHADLAAPLEIPHPPEAATLEPLPPAAPDTAFLAVSGQRREYVKLSQVKLFLACGEYSKACWGKDQNMMFRKPMKQWELELTGTHFVRVHRQAIINLNFFSHLDKSPDGQTQIHLHEFPQPVPVSQRCGPELNRQLKQFRPA